MDTASMAIPKTTNQLQRCQKMHTHSTAGETLIRVAILFSSGEGINKSPTPMQMWFHTTNTSSSNIIATSMLSTVIPLMQSSINSSTFTRDQTRQVLPLRVHPQPRRSFYETNRTLDKLIRSLNFNFHFIICTVEKMFLCTVYHFLFLLIHSFS